MREEKPAEFFEAIRDGVEGTAMPAWGDTLSEMDIWDVLYYEWTFATSPEKIAQGKELFAANCVTCHGAAGDGSGLAGAANFTDQAFMNNEDPLEFFKAIRDGVEGTAMPAWGEKLGEDQMWALVNFVWTFAYEYGEVGGEPSPMAVEPTQPPAVTEAPSLPTTPDPAVGQQLWQQKPCLGCHGSNAEGNIGPKLAGTGLSFDQVLLQVRTGAAPMPAYTEDQVSDLELQHMYAWLRSLAPPTPTPIAAPNFPTGALTAMWQHVNDMKVRCDFAKDLPERLASDDAGQLGILKQYATEAIQQGRAGIAQANQANIPVFTADIASTSPLGRVVAHVASDNKQGGRQAAQLLAEALHGEGNVAILSHPEVTSVTDRVAGFKEETAKHPGMSIVVELSAEGKRDKAVKVMEDLLQSHPDLRGVFAINDDSALGALAAVEAAGMLAQISIVGYDATPEARAKIETFVDCQAKRTLLELTEFVVQRER